MHEQYRKAMSGVRPSAQCTERILSMTEKKQTHLKKGWIIAAAAVLVLLCALFTANAATDGALFDGRLLQGLRVWINGEDYNLSDYQVDVYTRLDENGDNVVRHDYALPNDIEIHADVAEDYTAFSVDGDADSIRIQGTPATEEAE